MLRMSLKRRLRSMLPVLIDRPAENLPQTATGSLFTVTGPIVVTALYAQVTTAIEAATGTCVGKFVWTPNVGSPVDLTTATIDLDAAAVGQCVTMHLGFLGNIALKSSLAIYLSAASLGNQFLLLGGGVIGFNTSNDRTGQMKYALEYRPWHDKSTVVLS